MTERLVHWIRVPDVHSSFSVVEDLPPVDFSAHSSALHWIRLEGLSTTAQNLVEEFASSLHSTQILFTQKVSSGGERVTLLPAETRLVTTVIELLKSASVESQTLGNELQQSWNRFHEAPPTWTFRNRSLDFAATARPFLMGIVNVTPDSFSDGGQYASVEKAVEHGVRMVEEGADLLDIGGESTRPGAQKVSAEEEKQRVLPVIEALAKRVQVPLSIDTYKADVARAAVEAGAEIINDISCLRFDPELPRTIAETGAYFLLMHSRHTPSDMQKAPFYHHLWKELSQELEEGVQKALQAGVDRNKIGVDPGLGFGKRLQDNYRILREFSVLREWGLPILIGASRKSFLGHVLKTPDPSLRLEGSLATVAAACCENAQFVRVHDVAETSRFLRVAEAIRRPPLE